MNKYLDNCITNNIPTYRNFFIFNFQNKKFDISETFTLGDIKIYFYFDKLIINYNNVEYNIDSIRDSDKLVDKSVITEFKYSEVPSKSYHFKLNDIDIYYYHEMNHPFGRDTSVIYFIKDYEIIAAGVNGRDDYDNPWIYMLGKNLGKKFDEVIYKIAYMELLYPSNIGEINRYYDIKIPRYKPSSIMFAV